MEQKHATFESSPAYERKGSQDDLHEADRPKTKEELKHERILERQRLRVAKAAARRDDWVNLNVHDNDFIMGIASFFNKF